MEVFFGFSICYVIFGAQLFLIYEIITDYSKENGGKGLFLSMLIWPYFVVILFKEKIIKEGE